MLNTDGYIENRIAELYYSKEHNILLMTGQQAQRGGTRQGYVRIIATDIFNLVPNGVENVTEKVGLEIETNNGSISVKDTFAGTRTTYDITSRKETYQNLPSRINRMRR